MLITPEELDRIDLMVKRCAGVCDCGKLLHRLYSAYLIVSGELKKANNNTWNKIMEGQQVYKKKE